jgi:ribosomal protein L25 (general stress protein Ctc)
MSKYTDLPIQLGCLTKPSFISSQKAAACGTSTTTTRRWRSQKVNPENHGKMPLVVYGTGMMNNSLSFRGHRSHPNGKIFKALKERERSGQIVVLKIDEYLTSQVSLHDDVILSTDDVC